jgi:putative PIN family toxin of toxin-antitoxin system
LKAVFDTNVVASASFWNGAPFHCLAAWAEGRCEAALSPELLAEYHETILELRLDYPGRKCVEWARALSESAELVFPVERASGATPDPGDEMVLECAQAAEADFIVSGDKKHLLALRQFQGIPIVSPADFLRRLPPSRKSAV